MQRVLVLQRKKYGSARLLAGPNAAELTEVQSHHAEPRWQRSRDGAAMPSERDHASADTLARKHREDKSLLGDGGVEKGVQLVSEFANGSTKSLPFSHHEL